MDSLFLKDEVSTEMGQLHHFPTDEAAAKLIWLALRNITAQWKQPMLHWKAAMNQFAIVYGERFIPAITR